MGLHVPVDLEVDVSLIARVGHAVLAGGAQHVGQGGRVDGDDVPLIVGQRKADGRPKVDDRVGDGVVVEGAFHRPVGSVAA